MSASTTLASTASASTQTALSGVNAPWDTIWTSAASDAKASSLPLFFGSLFISQRKCETFSPLRLQTPTSARWGIPAATAPARTWWAASSAPAKTASNPAP